MRRFTCTSNGHFKFWEIERNAREETLQHARFMLEKALAVRSYTSTQVAPLLDGSVSADAALAVTDAPPPPPEPSARGFPAVLLQWSRSTAVRRYTTSSGPP